MVSPAQRKIKRWLEASPGRQQIGEIPLPFSGIAHRMARIALQVGGIALWWGGSAHRPSGRARWFFVAPLRFCGRPLRTGGIAHWRANTESRWAHTALR